MWRLTDKIAMLVCVFEKFVKLSGQSSLRENRILISMVNIKPHLFACLH